MPSMSAAEILTPCRSKFDLLFAVYIGHDASRCLTSSTGVTPSMPVHQALAQLHDDPSYAYDPTVRLGLVVLP